MNIAVITGASSGMGREFVLKLDKEREFDEIWVIARRIEPLLALAEQTRAKIRAISLDLTKSESMEEYSALLDAEKPSVKVLVNASGFGRFGAFEDIPLELQLEMFNLVKSLFIEVNPIPVKTALNMMGQEVGPLRLPLCDMSPDKKAKMLEIMKEAGIKF